MSWCGVRAGVWSAGGWGVRLGVGGSLGPCCGGLSVPLGLVSRVGLREILLNDHGVLGACTLTLTHGLNLQRASQTGRRTWGVGKAFLLQGRQTEIRSRTVEVASECRLSGERLALQLGCAGRDMRVRVGAAGRHELILQGQGDVHISGAELQGSGAPVVILALPVFTALGEGHEGAPSSSTKAFAITAFHFPLRRSKFIMDGIGVPPQCHSSTGRNRLVTDALTDVRPAEIKPPAVNPSA